MKNNECGHHFKLAVRLNQADCEDSLGYHRNAEQWDNIGFAVGVIGFAVVLYSYFF